MTDRSLTLYLYLSALFVAALVAANMVASKIIVLGGLFVPAGVLAYSITFAITDSVSEVWGRKRAQTLVKAGVAVQLLVWLLVALAIALPAAPFWHGQESFRSVLGATNRIIFASLVAYLLSQSLDVVLFHWLKERAHSRHLWFRNNLSTFISQTLDTAVFIVIAFAGTGQPLLQLIFGQLVIKYVIALLDTPVVYAMVWGLRRRLEDPTPGAA